MASRATRLLVVLTLASAILTTVQAQNILQMGNLETARSFCLRVSLQSSVAGIEGRSGDLRSHLLRQATLYGVPVEDCAFPSSLEKPVIDLTILALSNGYVVQAAVVVGMLFTFEEVVLGDVVIWDTLKLGTGSTDYDRIRGTAQELYEEILTDWRAMTGR